MSLALPSMFSTIRVQFVAERFRVLELSIVLGIEFGVIQHQLNGLVNF
jgi:hypothetical protein